MEILLWLVAYRVKGGDWFQSVRQKEDGHNDFRKGYVLIEFDNTELQNSRISKKSGITIILDCNFSQKT